jgi:hypothetical protein
MNAVDIDVPPERAMCRGLAVNAGNEFAAVGLASDMN